MPGFYSLYVGGDFEGTRLNRPLAERLDIAGLADTLDPLFERFAGDRRTTKASAISATGSASPHCASRSSHAKPAPPDPFHQPTEFLDRASSGVDAGAFDADAVLHDRVGGIDRDWSSVGCPGRLRLTPRQRAARAAFNVALGRIAADVLA